MQLKIRGKEQLFEHNITKDTIIIGRSSECDFCVPVDDLSRKHCQITIKGEYFFITDLGSKNGVTVDGILLTPNTPHALYPRNRVVIARFFELAIPGAQFSKDKPIGEISLITPVKRK